MKKIITLLLLVIGFSANATTFYISPLGSDVTGNGSLLTPWKTFYKASSVVTTAGDIIHVNAGTFVETVTSSLAKGVSVEGDGITSVITGVVGGEFTTTINLSSPEGTNGNQHISNVKFDGNNLAASLAMMINGRSNVSIYNCVFINFKYSAVMWSGTTNFSSGAPGIYAIGNSFYNNIVTNCAHAGVDYGRGAFQFGGQDGMLIYNNTMTETGRASGTQGWPIKNCNDGFTKNCKIYNNVIKVSPFPYPYSGFNNYWDFAIELFNEQGLEIFGNVVEGAIDMNRQTKGTSAYSVYIHDNIIGHNSNASTWEDGIILEYETTDAIIERNTIKNCMNAIVFSLRSGSVMNNIKIQNNLAYGIGITDGSKQGYAVRLIHNDENYSANTFAVTNNTFVALPGNNKPWWGIDIPAGSGSSNITMNNNVVMNFEAGSLVTSLGSKVTTLSIQNNVLFMAPVNITGTPVSYTNLNNISVDPDLNSNYLPNTTSPIYGKNIGYNTTIIIPPPPTPTNLTVLSTSLDSVASTEISIRFSLPIVSSVVKIKKGTSSISSTFTISGDKLIIKPSTTFALDALYTITVTATSTTGLVLSTPYVLGVKRSAKYYKQ